MIQELRTDKLVRFLAAAAWLAASPHPAACQATVKDPTHITVRHESGRYFGWPANCGIWSWGDEILVQYRSGEFQDRPPGSHDINYQKPIVVEQSRSLDGGFTWTHEAVPVAITEPGWGTQPLPANVPPLVKPIDFSHPDTILQFEWAGYLYYSTDRGRNWHGPFALPKLGMHTWQLRTDYLVEDRNTVLAFWSGSKERFKRDENGGMVYMVKSRDGGLSWELVSRVSRLVEPAEDRHDVALMPSTVRVSPTKLVTCIRNLTAYPKVAWIDCRASTDNGRTWRLLSIPVTEEAGTTPPALSRLPDGRLVLTYGHRKPLRGPTSIRAKLSEDDGASWGPEIILRTGGGDEDIGYTRNAVRPDGKVVTIYYWQENEKAERDIAATIWTPPPPRQTAGAVEEAGGTRTSMPQMASQPQSRDAAYHPHRALTAEELRQDFASPPMDARPRVFWFWWNSVVAREEIVRELEEMAAVGFGGVELRVVTFHGWGGRKLDWMDAASLERIGHRQLEYLSEEWVDTLAFTCATAERLGLRFSINLGQGWPPGGPWITDRHRTKHLSGEAREFEGPAAFVLEQASAEGMVLAWRLDTQGRGKTVAAGSFQDLSRFIRHEQGKRVLRWEAPAGRWLVGIFSVTPGGLCDKGEGPEVDPASSESVLFHLNYLFSRLDPKLSRFYGRTLVDVASDSWEYTRKRGGRYWSPAILEAFPRLGGYDLRQKLYALLGYGPDEKQVLHDLEEVERQLVRDNYFLRISSFLHERGLTFRPQIYGRGLKRDLLEAYALVDTPETEQGDYAVPEAVWAARTTGKALVSNESFTHLHRKIDPIRRPHGEWESNLAAMRGAANYLFGEGVNRIQMHSFSYSPPSLPLPGWRMYAELHLNRNVPWWPHIKALNLWLARRQWLLQAGWPVADALFYPVKSNPDDGPFRQMGNNQPVSAANAVDGANEHTLARIPDACSTGRYVVNNVILLGPLRTVPEAESILALLDCGARILATHSLPEEWPALKSDAAEGIRHRFAKALAEGRVLDARAGGWKAALAAVQSVRWSPPEARLMFQHRRVQGADIYLLVNPGDDFAGEVSFPHQGQRVELYDADRGRIAPAAQFTEREGRTYVPLRLAHAESVAFVFTPSPRPLFVTQSSGGEFEYDENARLLARFRASGTYEVKFSNGGTRLYSVALPPPIPVAGPWRLSVSPAQMVSPQAPLDLRLTRLASWRDVPGLKYYAGRATYRADFHLAEELARDGMGLMLDLGSLFESAEVAVNGAEAGIVYTPPYRVDITALVKVGRNVIEIEVANQLKNHLDRSDAYLRPSGLLGPVTIVPERRIRIGRP